MAESKAKSSKSSKSTKSTKSSASTKTTNPTTPTNTSRTKKKSDKTFFISVCSAIVAIVIIIVIAVVMSNKGLDDSYFVSDGTKYVLTIDTGEDPESEAEDNYAPIKIHLVYTYSGDEITGAKSYYEYPNAEKAKAAFDTMKENDAENEELASYELNGKYIIYTSSEESYKDLKASDVQAQIKMMEQSQQNSEEAELEAEAEESSDTEEEAKDSEE